jgi:D-amino peptidase
VKLYVSGDMEGVAGVCSWQQVDARTPHPEYAIFQRSYTREIAAAIAGARAAGAGDVLVNDAHGPMRNLLFDELPDDIRVVFGNRKPLSMVQNAQGFDGAFFIGYHGAIGDADAVLCHTYTPSVVHNVWLSGIRCSEATMNAALLGSFGVPLLLVSGDRTTVEGVQAQMPWVRGAIVKESIGNFAADSLTPGVARQLIQREAQLAIEQRTAARPFVIEPPIVLEIELSRVDQADYVAMIPGFERTGPRRIRFAHDDMTVIFKAFAATFRLGNV